MLKFFTLVLVMTVLVVSAVSITQQEIQRDQDQKLMIGAYDVALAAAINMKQADGRYPEAIDPMQMRSYLQSDEARRYAFLNSWDKKGFMVVPRIRTATIMYDNGVVDGGGPRIQAINAKGHVVKTIFLLSLRTRMVGAVDK